MSINIFGSSSKSNAANATKSYVDSKYIAMINNTKAKLNTTGDTMTGNLDMSGNSIHNVKDPVQNYDASNKNYVDTKLRALSSNLKFEKFEGDLNMNGFCITNVKQPVEEDDAVNKKYMHATIQNLYTLSTVGLIPHLSSSSDESDYTVLTSSDKDKNYSGFKAFNPMRGTAWRVADGVTSNFWIEIHCPEPVRIYKFTARTPLMTKLLKWKIQGANDRNPSWEDITFTPVIPIEDGITYTFRIDPKIAKEYQLYRILVEDAEGENPGLSHWQLYTVNSVYIS